MKMYLQLSVFALVAGIVMVSCETEPEEPATIEVELKKANNGMIKSYDNAVVLKWNEALSQAVDNRMPLPPEARIYAMVSLAVHDALNNVVPKFETYALDNSGVSAKDISKKNIQSVADAAVAQAAHDILTALVPASAPSAAVLLAECLDAVTDTELRDRGIQAGKEAALAVMAARSGDFPLRFDAYPQGTEPGEFRSPGIYAVANPPVWPANAAFAANMGQLQPFGMLSSDQFRARPPHPVNSAKYTADYNEVKLIGGETSTVRTPEQTATGIFFLDNVATSGNRIVRQLAVSNGLDGWETARLLALVHMAQFDAVLSSFEAAYFHNRWRPLTAINLGDTDGNDLTAGDASWSSLRAARATPPVPSYPATHAQAAGAVAEVLKQYFRRDNISFTIGSYSLPGVEKSFEAFSQYAREVSLSRIYIGYQFRDDISEGEKMGKELGKFIFSNQLGSR